MKSARQGANALRALCRNLAGPEVQEACSSGSADLRAASARFYTPLQRPSGPGFHSTRPLPSTSGASSEAVFRSVSSGRWGLGLTSRTFLRDAWERMMQIQARGWENFKKRVKPSARSASSSKDAKGNKGSGGDGPGGRPTPPIKEMLNQLALLFGAMTLVEVVLSSMSSDRAKEINFQTFYSDLLIKNRVTRLEVVNKNHVKVYTRPEAVEVDPSSRAKRLGPYGDEIPQGESDGDADPSVKTRVVPGGEVYAYWFTISSPDAFERKLEDAQYDLGWKPSQFVPVTHVARTNFLDLVMSWAPTLVTIAALGLLLRVNVNAFRNAAGRGSSGGFMQVGKAQVTVIDPKTVKNPMTFKDVAGVDEAKEEIMEFVQFLKDPRKYDKLGAKIPKGALLVGPPGTGKTLLAKATAGEAGVPFFSIAGSDFMEMFVGVGPARVRDLFAQARAQSPSIIFIDEIDAIGRSRGRGRVGGNEERENTLNQLLVEMDGFATKEGIVVLAGTNRADILDRALLRPGRFDRQITVDVPDVKGRTDIFKVHLNKLKTEKGIDYYAERLAALTPGFAGADIANVCNEAALQAARAACEVITLKHFEAAIDRVIGGLERRNRVVSKEERRTIAFHEAGHAAVGWFLEHTEPLLKVSIVPRGSAALGFAQYLPNEDVLKTREQVEDMICMTLGGRAAEELIVGRISTGAQNDLERVTGMAYNMVAVYGFSPRIGLLSFPPRDGALDKPYSPNTAQAIDEEVREIVNRAYARTKALVEERREAITKMAHALLEKEVLVLEDIEDIFGRRPFVTRAGANIDRYRGIRRELEGQEKEGGAEEKEGGKGEGQGESKREEGGDQTLSPSL